MRLLRSTIGFERDRRPAMKPRYCSISSFETGALGRNAETRVRYTSLVSIVAPRCPGGEKTLCARRPEINPRVVVDLARGPPRAHPRADRGEQGDQRRDQEEHEGQVDREDRQLDAARRPRRG